MRDLAQTLTHVHDAEIEIGEVRSRRNATGRCIKPAGVNRRGSPFFVRMHPNGDARILAAGKPRISPLVQLFQIGQTVHSQLLGIALTGRGQAFDVSRNFPS
jgi:hypothetical protein